MKKTVLIVLMILLSLCLFAGSLTNRNRAMGFTGLNVSDRQNNSFYNPASVYYYNRQSNFIINANFNDSFVNDKPFSLENPGATLSGLFAAKYICLSVDLGINAQTKADDTFKLEKTVEFSLDAAAGIGNFSAGLGVVLYSSRFKDNISFVQNRKLLDLWEKGVMSEFSRDNSISGATVKAGIGYLNNSWSFGLLFDDFIDSRQEGKIINWGRILQSFGCGIGYNTEPYTTRGKLNKWVFGFEAEVWNVISSNPVFHCGLDLSLVFVRSWSLSLCGGVRMPILDAKSGDSTYGLGIRMGDFDLTVNAVVPFGVYAGDTSGGISGSVDLTVLL